MKNAALISYAYESLVAYGAHFFLYLTLFIGIFADDWTEERGRVLPAGMGTASGAVDR